MTSDQNNMLFGLKEYEVHDMRSVFHMFPEIEEVIIYGSRAEGNYRKASDIDLALRGGEITSPMLNDIATQLDDLLLPYIMDVSLLHQIDNPELVDHIRRAGQTLYKK